jgi:hypothetical protein
MKIKILLYFIFTVYFILFSSKQVRAIYDPLTVPNNKYGIHIIDENDLENAATLVNSSNGDWGYVTIVITEEDRKEEKWNKIFDRLRQYHLIPIIRLATRVNQGVWEKPDDNEKYPWVNFLNGLNWPVKNRYVVLFNEPNHAKEYGGGINPTDYAGIVTSYSKSFKEKSTDFYIMMAGMDASAPNASNTMDEARYLRSMIEADKNIFEYVDGWVSHSYPNPAFSGKVTTVGRGSLKTYEWELRELAKYGINKYLPVFITETGWVHMEGENPNIYYYNSDSVSELIRMAAENIWNDAKIVAITPFVLNYPQYPFSHFSWTMPDNKGFYPQYDTYRSLPKIKGEPVLLEELLPQETDKIKGLEDDQKNFEEKKYDNYNRIQRYISGLVSKIFKIKL